MTTSTQRLKVGEVVRVAATVEWLDMIALVAPGPTRHAAPPVALKNLEADVLPAPPIDRDLVPAAQVFHSLFWSG